VGSDLLLLGVNDPENAFDLERLQRRFERPDFKAGFKRGKIDSFAMLLAHEIVPVDVLAATPLEGELHTLLHPRLSSLAARAFFVGAFGNLPPTLTPAAAELGKRNSLLARYTAARPQGFDTPLRLEVIEETCQHGMNLCAPLLARWIVDEPDSPERDRLRARIARNRKLARTVRLAMVDQLVPLFEGAPDDRPLKLSPAAAAKASNLFIEFYDHAAPFSRAALVRLWQRCESDPDQAQACIAARAKLETIVGDLRR
jgi:hypothetical protein